MVSYPNLVLLCIDKQQRQFNPVISPVSDLIAFTVKRLPPRVEPSIIASFDFIRIPIVEKPSLSVYVDVAKISVDAIFPILTLSTHEEGGLLAMRGRAPSSHSKLIVALRVCNDEHLEKLNLANVDILQSTNASQQTSLPQSFLYIFSSLALDLTDMNRSVDSDNWDLDSYPEHLFENSPPTSPSILQIFNQPKRGSSLAASVVNHRGHTTNIFFIPLILAIPHNTRRPSLLYSKCKEK